jgi:hypothetical protein
MPARSKAQANLARAAEHMAMFPLAKRLRESMSHQQLHDFAATPSKRLPRHTRKAKRTR